MTTLHDLDAQQLAASTSLAARFYTDTAIAEMERTAIFGRHWQLVAGVSQLTDRGDHVVTEVAGVPVIVVRDESGNLRAFHNVCRHRAGPLARCDGRGAKVLRCGYHGWTYGLDGQLRAATEMQDACDFKVSDVRLPEVSVATWRGLVFVALDPTLALDDLLRGTERLLGDRDFSDYRFDRRQGFPVPCNWKVYADNYLEGYHVPHIHPALNALLDYRNYVTETEHWHSVQWSPLEGDGLVYREGVALYFYLWPNLMLNILPDRLQTNRIVPRGVDRCRVDFDYFYPQGADADERRVADQDFSELVQAEDAEICERVQQALASGSYVPGRLNPKRENAVFHFHEQLRAAYRAAGVGG